jgi:hypothetical protein
MTNYFLPWLALAAQLPFESSGPWDTFIAFCLSLGSPALITYSLMITLLNRNWIQKPFTRLNDRAKHAKVRQRFPTYDKRVQAARYFLSESQQVPLRATQIQFQLASLIVLPKNGKWWKGLVHKLDRTRRGTTFSLIAQLLLVIGVWILTITSSLLAAIGNTTTALQIAASTLWIWLVC